MRKLTVAVACVLFVMVAAQAANCLEPQWASPIEQTWNALRSEATKSDQQGDWAEALRTAKRALTKAEGTFGPASLNAAKSHIMLGNLYAKRGKSVSAEIHYSRGICLFARILGSNHPAMLRPLALLAAVYEGKGKTADAEDTYRKAVVISEKSAPVDDAVKIEAFRGLSRMCELAGKSPESEQLLVKALQTCEHAASGVRGSVTLTGQILFDIGVSQVNQGNVAGAIQSYKKAIGSLDRQAADPLLVCSVWDRLGQAYATIGSDALAADSFRRARALRSKMMLASAESSEGL